MSPSPASPATQNPCHPFRSQDPGGHLPIPPAEADQALWDEFVRVTEGQIGDHRLSAAERQRYWTTARRSQPSRNITALADWPSSNIGSAFKPAPDQQPDDPGVRGLPTPSDARSPVFMRGWAEGLKAGLEDARDTEGRGRRALQFQGFCLGLLAAAALALLPVVIGWLQ